MMLTQEMVQNQRAMPNTTQIGDFGVKPGVPFELRIDVPSSFWKEDEETVRKNGGWGWPIPS
jgi:hypothetical protein